MYMGMARAAAMRSTCYRLNVGAILVLSQTNVVSIGYNGAPANVDHCTGNGCQHYTPTGCKVVHAERNAIERLYSWKTARVYQLYVTHSPCYDCAQLILDNGSISKVYFETAYRDPKPVELLLAGSKIVTSPTSERWERSPVDVYQMTPNGMLVDMRTGNLCEQ